MNHTFSKSLDTNQGVQNDSSNLGNPLYAAADYGPSRFDHTHRVNAMFVYNTPQSYSISPKAVNAVVGGWYVSSIFTALSGAPIYVTENAQVWGGGQRGDLWRHVQHCRSCDRQSSSRWMMFGARLEF